MKTILLTSIGSATAVNLLKLLKSKYYIIATDIYPLGYTAGSMMVDEFIPVPIYSTESYLEAICRIVKEKHVDLLIPVHDYEIQKIANWKDLIKAKVLVAPLSAISELGDKLNSAKRIADIGGITARIIYSDMSLDGIDKVIRREKKGVGSKGIDIYDSQCIPNGILRNSYETENYFVQEYIDGEEYTVDIASNKNGEPFLIIPRRRQEVKAGVATKVEIVCDEILINLVQKIAAYYRIPAFSNMQFIKKGDQYYFIEYNYRYGGMSIASALSSYNYVEAVVDNILEDKPLSTGINQFPIKWGAIVTRYYEEMIYEA